MTRVQWNRQRLDEMVAEEAEASSGAPDVVQALLAYARWKGLTEEAGVDRNAAKAELDRRLDLLDDNPQSWGAMKELVGRWNDAVLKDVVRYSVERTKERLWGPELDRAPWLDSPPPKIAEAAAEPAKSKRRSVWSRKERGRD